MGQILVRIISIGARLSFQITYGWLFRIVLIVFSPIILQDKFNFVSG